jgi:hypothetical protein
MSSSDASILVVKIGALVELELIDQLGRVEKMAVQIVDEKAADFKSGYLGSSTPLAQVILGQPAGKTLPYRVGDLRAVHVLSITTGANQPPENAAAMREAAIKRAVSEMDRTNAVLFAASFSGKWGDYDPDGIEKWEPDASDEAPKKPKVES